MGKVFVSASGGRFLTCNVDSDGLLTSQPTTARLGSSTFTKMTLLSDGATLLGLDFYGNLLLVDVQQEVGGGRVLGTLRHGVVDFATDLDQLVLSRTRENVCAVFRLSDPSRDLATYKGPLACTGLSHRDGLFLIHLKEI
jgi:hypothetical protein